jgi:predicted branched-subunit amino acid permease
VVTAALGAVFGNLIGNPAAYGLDFVVTAYFIHLVASFRERNNAVIVILASVAASLAVYLTAGAPWHIGGGAVAGMAVAAVLARSAAAATQAR